MKELDDKLSEDDLDNMIDEIDADGSGTVDWEGNITTTELFLIITKKLQNSKQWWLVNFTHERFPLRIRMFVLS